MNGLMEEKTISSPNKKNKIKSIYPILTLFISLSFTFTFSSCNQEDPSSIVDVNNGVYTFSFRSLESEDAYWTLGDTIGLSV
jgi:hypothetical protein